MLHVNTSLLAMLFYVSHCFSLIIQYQLDFVKYYRIILSVMQAQRIGTTTKSFAVSRVGNTLYYESKIHDVAVVWDIEMNIEIEVCVILRVFFQCKVFINTLAYLTVVTLTAAEILALQ